MPPYPTAIIHDKTESAGFLPGSQRSKSGGFSMGDNPTKAVELTAAEKALLVERKATCPFIGSAVADGVLPVRNDANDPLASIEDVRRLGNTGGGDLGDLLVLFASGNHAYMLGDSGKLDKRVPPGLFSLELPGSQGSHPGHSGILQADPDIPNSGRLSEADFARLTSRAKDGWIKRSEVGRFISENVLRDPKSRVLTKDTAALLASDLGDLVQITGSVLLGKLSPSGEDASRSRRDIEERLTKLLGEDNMVGSAGEFGLLFALLANKPGTRKIDGEPAVAVADLKAMFVDKYLPDGWGTWKKLRIDWVKNTLGLLVSAVKEYRTVKQTR
jgi:hypothetical protein